MLLEGPITLKKLAIKFGIWSGIYLLLAFFFENYEILPHYAYIRALYHIFFLMLIFYVTGALISHLYEKGRQWQFFIIVIGVMFLLSYINLKLAPLVMEDFGVPLPSSSPKTPRRFIFFTSLLTVAIGIFLFILKFKNRREKLLNEQLNEQKEAQLSFLKSQINPHFLFNTLNNIYSLAYKKSDKTPEMILLLSEILRYAIYESRKTLVSQTKELEQVKKLIALYRMKTEYPEKIKYQEKGCFDNMPTEPMILVPLVENCLKHSNIETDPLGLIEIEAYEENNKFIFKTFNSYDSKDLQRQKEGGVGLENIRKRLNLRHPNQHELKISKTENKFSLVLEITNT